VLFGFLRSLDRRAIVLVAQRLLSAVLPCKPYAACGYAPRCPCPNAPVHETTGVAIGDAITMNLAGEYCPCERTEFPGHK
jgi:hypothetical protein